MTNDEIKALNACLVNLDLAILSKTPKAFMRVLTHQVREELRSLTKNNLTTGENVLTTEECGK